MRWLHSHGAMACCNWAASRPGAGRTNPRRFTDAHKRAAKANWFRLLRRRSIARRCRLWSASAICSFAGELSQKQVRGLRLCPLTP